LVVVQPNQQTMLMRSKNLKRKQRKSQNKMKHNCRQCTFHWDGFSDTFDKVLIHEKTHIKKVVE
jgi:hypothetical protein